MGVVQVADDDDMRVLNEALDRSCPHGERDAASPPDARLVHRPREGGEPCAEARDALVRVGRRLEAADDMHHMLAEGYTLVWPVPGVLMSRKRRKRAVEKYEHSRPRPPVEDDQA